MTRLAFLTMGLSMSLGIVSAVANPILVIDGEAIEFQITTDANLQKVLDYYECGNGDINSLMMFLTNALSIARPSFDIASFEPVSLEQGIPQSGRDPIWRLHGSIGTLSYWIDLGAYGQNLSISISHYVGSEVVTEYLAYDVYEAIDDPVPNRPIALHPVSTLTCCCDTAGGGSCTDQMCDDLATCPNKNGTSCAWQNVFV